MRKRTLKNIFIRLLRFTFLILPLLLAVIFTYTKLPLGTTSWDYDDGNYLIDGDSLSDRFSSWFLSTIYKPLSSMGLKNTFVYSGTSHLMSLLGFEPVVEVVDTRSSLRTSYVDTAFSTGLDSYGISFPFYVSGNTVPAMNSYLSTVCTHYNVPVELVIFSDGSYIYAVLDDRDRYWLRFLPFGSTYVDLYRSDRYGFEVSSPYIFNEPLSVVSVTSSYDSQYLLSYSLESDPEPDPEPVELTNPYVDFIALYLSYIIFVYLFEVFIRVLVWIPRWIIHYLDKPFLVVGEDDVD